MFLSWLPRNAEELDNLNQSGHSGSRLGGTVFLLVAFCSLAYILIVGTLNIVSPRWAGGSR